MADRGGHRPEPAPADDRSQGAEEAAGLTHIYAPGEPSFGSGYSASLAPVVLPPNDPVYQPATSSDRRARAQRSWAAAPATYLLLGVNVAVFLAMSLSGVSPVSPQPEQLIAWGANNGGYVLVLGQWWRLFTAGFVHIGFLHLLTNMWCLWNLGLLGEPLLGTSGLVGTYLLTAAAGNLLSIVIHPGLDGGGEVGAGASGAIFGLAGVLIVLLNSRYLPLRPADRKSLRGNVIWFAALNFVLAVGVNAGHFSLRVDNSAHIGGFAAGLLLALGLVPRIGSPTRLFTRRRNLALAGGALLLALLCSGVRAFYLGAAQAT